MNKLSASPAVGTAEISQSMCVNHTVTYEQMASDYVDTEFEIDCSNETHVSVLHLYKTSCWHSLFCLEDIHSTCCVHGIYYVCNYYTITTML